MSPELLEQGNNLRKTRDLLLPKLISSEIDVDGVGNDVSESACFRFSGHASPIAGKLFCHFCFFKNGARFMKMTAIPDWTPTGVLPPINPANPATVNRSPYRVTLMDFVLRFNTTAARQKILAGFLKHRSELHRIGLVRGFQWVDGSFLEDVEKIENRDPRDMDVVTFFYLPEGETQNSVLAANTSIFSSRAAKNAFHVDAYFVQLNTPVIEPLVERSTYWYSMWAHRRSGEWKGYLQIDLAPTDDVAASANVSACDYNGGQP